MLVPGKSVTRGINFFTCQNLVAGMILKLNIVKNIYNTPPGGDFIKVGPRA
jgi:hypothetical protein